MENEFLTFETTDVELIGDVIEFDEEVQRGEKVRFYTLNEQVTDAFDHMIPKGRTTRAQLEKIDKEVDRMKELYTTFVSPNAEGYEVIVPESLRTFSWISPVTSEKQYSAYSYQEQWIPLFSPDAIRQPNGYTRMLTALPTPFVADQGQPYSITTPTEFVNNEGVTQIRALPAFVMNKTRRHEDGRIDVMNVPVGGEDIVNFTGFWLRKRHLPIPNPLPDHPFLSSNDESFYQTTEPLSEVVPRMETVMMHGVPVTQDPYGEGAKYLKLYDVSLDAVPWEYWKQRFPKKEVVDTMPPPIDITIPKKEDNPPPSTNIIKEYGQPYFPGLSARKWLMTQEDGGHLIVKMIQSLSGNAGTMGMLPVSELGDIRFPDVDDDQCNLVGLTFNDFAIQGVVRQLEMYDKGKFIGYNRKCLPLDIIKQERHQIGYRNRLQWKESTHDDILKEYTRALAMSRTFKSQTKVNYEKYIARSVSQLRDQVVAVLKDENRFPEDKLKAIQILTRDAPRDRKITVDAEGLFVVCDHTIAILSGDMAADRLGFYDTWTVRVDGSRVCKVCGEEVNRDVLVNQEDFSEEGRVLKHADALEETTFHGHATLNFTAKLRSLQEFFDVAEPADSTVFLLISLLQVLPSQEQFLPILQEARALSDSLRSRDRDGKARGMVGIAATVLLLQTHLPQLVPRRSFGTPLKMDGFPRDTDSDKAPTVIDSLMVVLRKTFEAYPTSFKGPSVAVMRGVLSEPASIRKGVISIVKKLMPMFSAPLLRAKSEFALQPPSAPIVGLIPVKLPPTELGVVTAFPQCGNPHSIWADPKPPIVRQPVVPLDRVRPLSSTLPLLREVVTMRPLTTPDVKEIQRRIKLPAVKAGDSWRTNLMIVQRLKDLFELDVDVGSIDVTQKPSLLRDISEGLLKEVVSMITKDPVKRRAYDELREKDLTLFALLAQLKDARTETNTLRAKERHLFTDRLREMTDSQRQITKDLLDRGMAPYIITNADRDVFAAQIERELGPLEEDIGVGAPRAAPDDDDRNADEGDYGDHTAQSNRERDQDMPEIDEDGPI